MELNSPLKVTIDASSLKGEFRPILARFTNGKLLSGQMSLKYRLHSNTLEDKDFSKRKILVSESEKLSYVGRNFVVGASQPPTFKYLLGILDKNTGKMRVCDADLFHMLPVIKGQNSSVEPAVQPKNKSYLEERDNLTAAFGSSIRKRAMEARVRNKVSSDTFDKLADITIVDANKSVNSSSTSIGSALDHILDILPPMNRDAERVNDVYQHQELLNTIEWKAIEDIAIEAKNDIPGQIVMWQQQQYPEISIRQLPKTMKLEIIQLLVYMNYLASMLKFKSKDKAKKDPFNKNIPLIIRKKLLREFTKQGIGAVKIEIDSRLRDKICLHLLMLALIVTDFEVETAILQKDFLIQPSRLKSLYAMLGVNVAKSRTTKQEVARLSFPLVPPPTLSNRSRAKRL